MSRTLDSCYKWIFTVHGYLMVSTNGEMFQRMCRLFHRADCHWASVRVSKTLKHYEQIDLIESQLLDEKLTGNHQASHHPTGRTTYTLALGDAPEAGQSLTTNVSAQLHSLTHRSEPNVNKYTPRAGDVSSCLVFRFGWKINPVDDSISALYQIWISIERFDLFDYFVML